MHRLQAPAAWAGGTFVLTVESLWKKPKIVMRDHLWRVVEPDIFGNRGITEQNLRAVQAVYGVNKLETDVE